MRNPHYLSNSDGNKRPDNLIFYDTETTVTKLEDGSEYHKLKLGYALFCQLNHSGQLTVTNELEFYTFEEFNKWIVKLANKHDHLHIISHNIVYDIAATHSLVELPKAGYKVVSLYSKATTTLIKLKNNKRYIWLLDNSNFFQGKLEKLASLTDVPKLTINFDNCTLDELMTYCKRDVEIIYKLWQLWFRFLNDNNIGNFKMTTSSTAFEAYRHKFIPHTIAIHNNKEAIDLERKAYHGEDASVSFLGYTEGDYYYLDVNSMYPYIMSDNYFPYRLQTHHNKAHVSSLARWLETYNVIATVKLETDINPYPAMLDGMLCYPVGEFITTLSSPELSYALQHDHIREVYQCAYYSRYKLFSDYVSYFYNLRMKYKIEDNRAFELICKLFGNGLYGKFGQKEINQSIIGEVDPELVDTLYGFDADTETRYTDVSLGGVIIRTTEGEVSYNAFPAIAAHVTAYARMYLWSIIEQIPAGHYYYCDTDSVIVDRTGYEILHHKLDDYQLGGLKIEKQSNWLGVAAPKCYNMEGRFKLKGVSSNANYVDELTWQQTRWPKLGSMLANYGVTDYHTFPQRKVISFANKQVKVSSSSQFSQPLRLTVSEGVNCLSEE